MSSVRSSPKRVQTLYVPVHKRQDSNNNPNPAIVDVNTVPKPEPHKKSKKSQASSKKSLKSKSPQQETSNNISKEQTTMPVKTDHVTPAKATSEDTTNITPSDTESKKPTCSSNTLRSPPTVVLSFSELQISAASAPKTLPPTPPPTVTLSFAELARQTDQLSDVTEFERQDIKDCTVAGNLEATTDQVDTNDGNDGDDVEVDDEEEWEQQWADGLSTLTSRQQPARPQRGRGSSKFNTKDNDATDWDGAGENDRDRDGDGDTGDRVSDGSEGAQTQTHGQGQGQARHLGGHIIEIHSFPDTVKTADLEQLLGEYKGLVRFKWVNDTSALAIFRTASFAQDAMRTVNQPPFRMRPISEASQEAQGAARRIGSRAGHDHDMPSPDHSEPRPYRTTTSVARRLIANALQINLVSGSGSGSGSGSDDSRRRRSMWDSDDD